MTRVVVHIGAAKTATTYIQHSLYDNEVGLREYGVYLPKAGRFRFSEKTVLHHNLAWEYLEPARFDSKAGGWDALLEEVRGVEADVVLLSSEALERMTYSKPQRELLEAQLQRISDDVTILYVVRDQLSYLNSLYNQNIKSFRLVETFNDYATRILQTGQLDLDNRFKSWYSSDTLTFMAVHFDTLTEGNVLQNFLKAAGIDIPRDRLTRPRDVSNESLGPIGVEACRLLGSYLRVLDPAFDYRTYETLKAYRVSARKARENGWCNESYWGWEQAFARTVATRLQGSNERFAQSVWGPDGEVALPAERAMRAVRLMDQTLHELQSVHRFVGVMSRRYISLKTGRGSGRADAVEDEEADETP